MMPVALATTHSPSEAIASIEQMDFAFTVSPLLRRGSPAGTFRRC
jgi:hypothetical protein